MPKRQRFLHDNHRPNNNNNNNHLGHITNFDNVVITNDNTHHTLQEINNSFRQPNSMDWGQSLAAPVVRGATHNNNNAATTTTTMVDTSTLAQARLVVAEAQALLTGAATATAVASPDDMVSEEEESPLPTKKRRRKRSLGADKQKKQEEVWWSMFAKLQAFYDKTGHSNVTYRCPDDPSLGKWVRAQRHQKTNGVLTCPKRLAALDRVQFSWRLGPAKGRTWEEHFQKLLEYRLEHGHCDVPRIYAEDQTFANWCIRMRTYYHKNQLPSDQIKKLKNLGLNLNYDESKKKESKTTAANNKETEQTNTTAAVATVANMSPPPQQQQQQAFRPMGMFPPMMGPTFPPPPHLRGPQIPFQRGPLLHLPPAPTPMQAAQQNVNAMGVKNNTPLWYRCYEQLKAYHRKFGHTRVLFDGDQQIEIDNSPPNSSSPADPRRATTTSTLAYWVERQRHLYQTQQLLPHFAQLLRDLDMHFFTTQMPTNTAATNTQPSPSKTNHKDDTNTDVNEDEKVSTTNSASWKDRIKRLEAYKRLLLGPYVYHHHRLHPHYCQITSDCLPKDDPALDQWLDQQRQACKNHELSADQLQQLQELGFLSKHDNNATTPTTTTADPSNDSHPMPAAETETQKTVAAEGNRIGNSNAIDDEQGPTENTKTSGGLTDKGNHAGEEENDDDDAMDPTAADTAMPLAFDTEADQESTNKTTEEEPPGSLSPETFFDAIDQSPNSAMSPVLQQDEQINDSAETGEATETPSLENKDTGSTAGQEATKATSAITAANDTDVSDIGASSAGQHARSPETTAPAATGAPTTGLDSPQNETEKQALAPAAAPAATGPPPPAVLLQSYPPPQPPLFFNQFRPYGAAVGLLPPSTNAAIPRPIISPQPQLQAENNRLRPYSAVVAMTKPRRKAGVAPTASPPAMAAPQPQPPLQAGNDGMRPYSAAVRIGAIPTGNPPAMAVPQLQAENTRSRPYGAAVGMAPAATTGAFPPGGLPAMAAGTQQQTPGQLQAENARLRHEVALLQRDNARLRQLSQSQIQLEDRIKQQNLQISQQEKKILEQKRDLRFANTKIRELREYNAKEVADSIVL